MGFGDACINIMLMTQGFLSLPVIYNKSTDKVEPNPKIFSELRMWHWYMGNCFITTVHIFSAVHLVFLLKGFDVTSAEKSKKEEVFIYIFTVAITAQAIFTWVTLEKDSGWIARVEAQIFSAFNVKNRGWPNSKRRPDIFETTAYGMAIAFFLFPFSTLVLPIIRTYDPINQMFEILVPISVHPKQQKAIVVLLYLWSVYFGALSSLNIVLLTMTHCYALSMIAKQNLIASIEYLSRCPSIKLQKPKMITANNILTYTGVRNLKKFFNKRCILHNQFRFMITSINIGLGWYIPASTGVGMSLCIASNFGLIELFGRLPKIMVASMMVTTLGFSVLIMHLLHYAAGPLTYSQMLVHFWGKFKMGILERRQLRAMIPIGFAMGEYFTIKKRTSLDIMDSILNYTVSALMG